METTIQEEEKQNLFLSAGQFGESGKEKKLAKYIFRAFPHLMKISASLIRQFTCIFK